MSYITQAELRRDSAGQRALADLVNGRVSDEGHRLIWTLFAHPKAVRDFVFRRTAAFSYLIVSARPPVDPASLWTLRSKPYAPRLTADDRVRFALRANPTQSRRVESRARGQRVDAITAHAPGQRLSGAAIQAQALAWLLRRERALGVRVDPEALRADNYRRFLVPRDGAPPAQLSSIDLEGVLTVEDPIRLARAAREGVGHARAFGCGLLLLRPAAPPPGVPGPQA